MGNDLEMDAFDFGELDDMFGDLDEDLENSQKVVLTQDLEGFASCFPEWDIHPPVRR